MHKFQTRLNSATQKGFTLIELVIVIVIIGILAAVAIPNFTNVSDDAKKGVANGTAGALASWAATNYATCQGKLASAVASAGCNAAGMSGAGLTGSAAGDVAGCVVTVNSVASASIVGVRTTGTSCL